MLEGVTCQCENGRHPTYSKERSERRDQPVTSCRGLLSSALPVRLIVAGRRVVLVRESTVGVGLDVEVARRNVGALTNGLELKVKVLMRSRCCQIKFRTDRKGRVVGQRRVDGVSDGEVDSDLVQIMLQHNDPVQQP